MGMDLDLTAEERASLEATAAGGHATAAPAAAILLARAGGRSYREAAAGVGRSKQYAYQVARCFLERGRLASPPLRESGNKTPYSMRRAAR